MTTLAAWVGIDQRAPASLYVASDSRFTQRGWFKWKTSTNEGQKVFACKVEPHLFGYCGWVAFPSQVISDAVVLIDSGQLFGNYADAYRRQKAFESYIQMRLDDELKKVRRHRAAEFSILHAAREAAGMVSVFRLWILQWHPHRGWCIREKQLPESSGVLFAGGSGADAFLQRDVSWKESDIGRTSRGVFSAFVEALQAGYDQFSGGAPQLGGIFRKGRAMEFGIVYNQTRFLCGRPVSSTAIPENLDWFNELFERTDPQTMKRLPYAQRHAKPSWLRPYNE